MYKFAHITDCHLGSWRDTTLRELNLKAFEEAISICIQEKVDFLVITGDFFDVNVPDLRPVKRAVEILKSARDKGIEIYLIYGSHDFSPNSVSMVDVLHSAGLFIKPIDFEQMDGKLKLRVFQDAKTGAKITGLSGRKMGLDKQYYEMLDRENLEKENGFKIFLFHAPISELVPIEFAYGDSVPLSLFPSNFNYYGGGHLHKRIEHHSDSHKNIIYPGPLFGSTFSDLEKSAEGERRGFYIIEFDNEVRKISFAEVNVCEIVFSAIDANKKTAQQVQQDIIAKIEEIEANGKIVLVKVRGVLSMGKRSEINFVGLKEMLIEKGAFVAHINHQSLTSEEKTKVKVVGENKEEIEEKILKERLASFKLDSAISDDKVKEFVKKSLIGQGGLQTAKNLIHVLKEEKKENETNETFTGRIVDDVRTTVKLEES